MRINLKCPFEQKDEAKRLGARWDPVKRTWFIVDIEDLTPFMSWISRVDGSMAGRKAKSHTPKTTCSSTQVESCGCDHVLPWEHCEHSLIAHNKLPQSQQPVVHYTP